MKLEFYFEFCISHSIPLLKVNRRRLHTKLDVLLSVPKNRLLGYLLFGLLIYFPSFHTGFFSDDWYYLELLNRGGWSSYKTNWDDQFFIPLTHLVEHVEFTLFGLNPLPYHLVHFLVHVGVAYLISGSCHHIVKSSQIVYFLTGLLFLVWPYHSETVIWYAAKSYLFSSFFCLMSFQLFMKRAHWTLVCLTFTASVLFKEITILFPVILLFIALINGHLKSTLKVYLIPLAVCLCVIVGIRSFVLGDLIGGYGASTHLPSVATLLKNFFVYGLKFLGFFRYFKAFGLAEISYLLSISSFLIFAFTWIKNRTSKSFNRTMTLLVIAYVLLLFPVLGLEISSVYSIESDRYSYGVSIIVVFLITYTLSELKSKFQSGTLVVLIAMCTVFSIQNVKTWVTAADIRDDYFNQIVKYVSAKKATVIINAPDNYNGAYIYRNGLDKQLQVDGINATVLTTQLINSLPWGMAREPKTYKFKTNKNPIYVCKSERIKCTSLAKEINLDTKSFKEATILYYSEDGIVKKVQ